jgi:hypothetical protein
MFDNTNKDEVKLYSIRMCDVPEWVYTAFKNEGKVLIDKDDLTLALDWLAFLKFHMGCTMPGVLFDRIKAQMEQYA